MDNQAPLFIHFFSEAIVLHRAFVSKRKFTVYVKS